jgi:NADH-quinone oxidoreductase subunit K
MSAIPYEHGLVVAGVLLFIGLVGVLVRRDVLFTLLSLEVMLNSAGMAFVFAGSRWNQADGQVMFLLILAVAAVEVSIGLVLVLWLFRWNKTVDIDRARTLRG